jgi:hypothetical protein
LILVLLHGTDLSRNIGFGDQKMDVKDIKSEINSSIEALRRLGTPEDLVSVLLSLSDVDLEKVLTATLLSKEELLLILPEVMEGIFGRLCFRRDLIYKHKSKSPAVKAKEFKYLGMLHESIKCNFAKIESWYKVKITVYYQFYVKKEEASELIPFTQEPDVLIQLGARVCYLCVYRGIDHLYQLNQKDLRCSVHPKTDIAFDEVGNDCLDFCAETDLFASYPDK